MKVIIALTGYKRSGKDTCANAIADYCISSYKTNVYKFAQPLIQEACSVFGVSDYENNKELVKNINGKQISLREYMIETASKFRKSNPYHYSSILVNKIKKDWDKYDIFVVSDLRFKDEWFDLYRNFECAVPIVKINRPGVECDCSQEPERAINELPYVLSITNNKISFFKEDCCYLVRSIENVRYRYMLEARQLAKYYGIPVSHIDKFAEDYYSLLRSNNKKYVMHTMLSKIQKGEYK